MNDWLLTGLSNAVLASLLALIAMAVSRSGKSPTLAHALWVLVLIKLVTPTFVPIPVIQTAQPSANETRVADVPKRPAEAAPRESVPRDWFDGRDTTDGRDRDDRFSWPHASPDTSPSDQRLSRDALSLHSSGSVTGSDREATESTASSSSMAAQATGSTQRSGEGGRRVSSFISNVHWTSVAMTIWFVGAIVFLARAGWHLERFRRLLRHSHEANDDLIDFVDRLSKRMGLRHRPRLRLVPGSVSPMVFSFGLSPQLILPKDLAGWLKDSEQLETLIMHELAHLKRRDHWVRYLELIVSSLYWWLPTVWLAKRGIREVEEEVCDAWVVHTLPTASRSYAEALINTADFLDDRSTCLPPMGCAISHFRFIKRRITMIMKGTVSTRLAWSSRLMLWMVGAAFLPLSLGLAAAPSEAATKFLSVEAEVQPQPTVGVQDDDDQEDAEDIRQEILEELKSEIGEIDEEIAEAIEEVRSELLEELQSAPPYVQKIVSELDIEAMLDEMLEDAPTVIRSFVDQVEIEEIVEEALEGVDLDDIALSIGQIDELQEMLESELGGELHRATEELAEELERAQDEIERAMQEAPPEIRAMLEEMDIEKLIESALEGTSPLVRELADEVGIEEIMESEFRDDDGDEADEQRREQRERRRRDRDDDEEEEDEEDGDDREEIEERLERRLEQLLKEADEIRQELRSLRRDRGGRR